MKLIYSILFCLLIGASQLFAQVTVQQALEVISNARVNGGTLKIGLNLKANGLPAEGATLGSWTIDVTFDNTKLQWLNGSSNFGPTGLMGYSRSYTNNTTFIRVGCLPVSVDGVDYLGWNWPAAYTKVGELNFKILDAASAPSFTFKLGGVFSYFNTLGNGDGSGLTTPAVPDASLNLTDIALPVELSSFTASASAKHVSLAWKTATERNNYGFEIERRAATSAQTMGEWSKLGFVEGAGTSSTPKSYGYSDNATAGKYEYRLKQVDRDGNYEYSKTIEATVAFTAADFGMTQNYPNPFNPSTTIRFAVKTAQHAVVKIFNSLGQEVRTLFNETAQPETMYALTFDAAGLPSGSYYYMLRTADRNEVRRMMLLK